MNILHTFAIEVAIAAVISHFAKPIVANDGVSIFINFCCTPGFVGIVSVGTASVANLIAYERKYTLGGTRAFKIKSSEYPSMCVSHNFCVVSCTNGPALYRKRKISQFSPQATQKEIITKLTLS